VREGLDKDTIYHSFLLAREKSNELEFDWLFKRYDVISQVAILVIVYDVNLEAFKR